MNLCSANISSTSYGNECNTKSERKCEEANVIRFTTMQLSFIACARLFFTLVNCIYHLRRRNSIAFKILYILLNRIGMKTKPLGLPTECHDRNKLFLSDSST